MINIHELRIGNWVQYDDGPTPTKVHSIDFYRENVGVERFPQPLSPSVLLPIELTPELLEACAFDFRKDDKVWYIQVGNTNYLELDDQLLCGVTPETWQDQCPIYIWAKVRHVHQLQNLYFALTGTELSVNLEKVKA